LDFGETLQLKIYLCAPRRSAGLASGFFKRPSFFRLLAKASTIQTKIPKQDVTFLCFAVFDKQKVGNEQPMDLSATKGRFEF
jgi:hypothetical protein